MDELASFSMRVPGQVDVGADVPDPGLRGMQFPGRNRAGALAAFDYPIVGVLRRDRIFGRTSR